MRHTNEFLQMMHCAYMGCSVIDNKENRVGKVISANTTRVWYEHPNNKVNSRPTQSFAFYGECKPILTPLSEITDDSGTCDGINKILAHHDLTENKIMYVDMYEFIHSIMNGNSNDYSDSVCGYVLCEITDYLRSKHYDCGYMHIPSLIQADLAISSKQI